VPLMLHEVVDVRHWLDSKTFMDGIALGQVTPGPIVITATFVGYQIAGVLGAIVGTIGIFTPSFLMALVNGPILRPAATLAVVSPGIAGRPGLLRGAAGSRCHQLWHGGLVDGSGCPNRGGGACGATIQDRHPLGRSRRGRRVGVRPVRSEFAIGISSEQLMLS